MPMPESVETCLKGVVGLCCGVVVGIWTTWSLTRVTTKKVSAKEALKDAQTGTDFTLFRFVLPTVAAERWLTLFGAAAYAVGLVVVMAKWWHRAGVDERRARIIKERSDILRPLLKNGKLDWTDPSVREQTKDLLQILGHDV